MCHLHHHHFCDYISCQCQFCDHISCHHHFCDHTSCHRQLCDHISCDHRDQVLKPQVWVAILGAVIVTALMLWILDRFSPYSARWTIIVLIMIIIMIIVAIFVAHFLSIYKHHHHCHRFGVLSGTTRRLIQSPAESSPSRNLSGSHSRLSHHR